MIKVVQIAVGEMQANAFLVFKQTSKQAFVVDPGAQADKILSQIARNGITEVTHILLTHGHYDHMGAAAELRRATGAKVCIHERDLAMLSSSAASLAAMIGGEYRACEADIVLKGGELIQAADMNVQVLHTSGHSGGSVCYVTGNAMFSGDTLFYRFRGRTDFPGSDEREYAHTLSVILPSLQDDYQVYTGHGVKTTLFEEMALNP